MSFIVAIDVGGTAVKVAVYDPQGRERAVAGEVVPALAPRPGWAERDAEALWGTASRLIRIALERADVSGSDVATVGLTGYGNGLLLVDAAGRPVRPAILATDTRAATIVGGWRASGLEPRHIALTHQPLWPGKPVPLLAWLEAHEPETLTRAHDLLCCKDFLRLRLTGVAALEVSDASTSSLLDHGGRTLTSAVLDHLGLGRYRSLMTSLLEPLTIAGAVTATAAEATGLRVGTPVSSGYADGPAMALATGVSDATRISVVAGTWGLNQLVSPEPRTDGAILACSLGLRSGEYIHVEGGPTSAGALEWFLRTARPEDPDPYAWSNAAVEGLDPDDPPLIFLPFPHGRLDDPDARAAFIGLSAQHSLAHMTRAVFEGVALEHELHVEALTVGRAPPEVVRFAGGGSRSRPWLEIFSAALRRPIEVSAANELGGLGAAIVAAVAVGLHPDVETAVRCMTSVDRRVDPDKALCERLDRCRPRYRQMRKLTTSAA